jgi:signal transduction histidine kinase/AraC-like DNA-binding protein/ligand-binding sensor domain-containing protein
MRVLLTISALLLFKLFCYPAKPSYRFGSIGPQQGLTEGYVESVAQDSRGYLWIATSDGLYRFDGYRCKRYTSSEADTSSILHNFTSHLTEDSQGRLWVSYRFAGMSVYRPETDDFTSMAFADTSLSNLVFKNSLRCITEDNEANIWVLNAYGIAKYTPSTERWAWYSQTIDSLPISDLYSYAIHQSLMGNIYFGFLTYGHLFVYDKHTDGFHRINLQPEDQSYAQPRSISCIAEGPGGNLWLGTIESGLLRADMATRTYKQYSVENSSGLASNEISTLFNDTGGRLWVGTVNGGLSLYNPQTDSFYTYLPDEYPYNGLKSRTIVGITEDTNGNLYFATHGGGVATLNMRNNVFTFVGKNSCGSNGLQSAVVSSILEAGYKLLIGTDGGGLHAYSLETGRTEPIMQPGMPEVILSILPRGDGRYWLATWGQGIVLWDPSGKKTNSFSPVNIPGSLFQNIKGIAQNGGYLWAATHGRGVAIINTLTNTAHTASNPAPGFSFDYATPQWGNQVVPENDTTVWVLASLGLYRCTPTSVQSFFTYTTSDESTVVGIMNCGIISSRGNFYVGANGLLLYDKASDRFNLLNDIYPDIPKPVRSIAEDADGNLWLGSNNGLARFCTRTGRIDMFTESDGLPALFFTDRASARLSCGRLAFGTNKGLLLFDPADVYPLDEEVPLYIYATRTSLEQGGALQAIKLSAGGKVPYKQSRILGFQFSGVPLLAADKLSYSFKLEGFDPDWRQAGQVLEATYTNLPPGNYRFSVKLKMGQGQWQETQYFDFQIMKAWYMSWWFRIAVLIFIVSAAAAFIYYRMAQIRAYAAKLEKSVAERTSEIEDANVELSAQREEILLQYSQLRGSQQLIQLRNEELYETMQQKDKMLSVLGHDLKNSLGNILGYTSIIKDRFSSLSHDKLREYVGLMHDAGHSFSEQMTELIVWAKSQSSSLAYKPSEIDVSAFARESLTCLSQTIAKKNIAVSVSGQAYRYCFADPRMLSSVLRNIIGNALKFLPDSGSLEIEITEQSGQAHIRIADSGPGIEPARIKEFYASGSISSTPAPDGEQGSGMGLSLCRDFIAACRGQLNISSPPPGAATGTEVRISLPLSEREISKSELQFSQSSFEHIGKIMLAVDDNFAVLSMIRDVFSAYFTVYTASSGKEALAKINDLVPDIVVSDIEMPDMTGIELCSQIKNERLSSHIPVVLITGHSSLENQLAGIESGADDYFTKPFDPGVMLAKIDAIFHARERMREYLRLQMLSNPEQQEMPETRDEHLVKQIKDMVDKNIKAPDLSVEFLADELGMSRSHLYRKFKSILGYSPVEYIRVYRIRRAAELLKNKGFRVSEVAYDVGFSDPKYFSSCFKKEFGQTPSEYQQSLGG